VPTRLSTYFASLILATFLIMMGQHAVAAQMPLLSLEGTWTMAGAYELRVDGSKTTNYGEHPRGILMVDKQGRYSMQIFRPNRPKFASGVKAKGTSEEYREAVVGSSTHTGQVVVDSADHKLIFRIETSSFPNWEGTEQTRDYVYADGKLTYSVPASVSGNGTVAYSIWRRAH
jgi:hypothetical protein